MAGSNRSGDLADPQVSSYKYDPVIVMTIMMMMIMKIMMTMTLTFWRVEFPGFNTCRNNLCHLHNWVSYKIYKNNKTY